MSRSGYSEDYDGWDFPELAMGRWRGVVLSATRGKRGQAFLKDLLAALDAMPEKRLIADDLERNGEFCTIGALGHKRGVDMSKLDPDDYDSVAATFGIASPLAQEVVFMNDEGFHCKTPEERWHKMRNWVASQIKPDTAS